MGTFFKEFYQMYNSLFSLVPNLEMPSVRYGGKKVHCQETYVVTFVYIFAHLKLAKFQCIFFYSTIFENNVLCIQNTNTYSWRVWQTKHNLLLTQIQKKLCSSGGVIYQFCLVSRQIFLNIHILTIHKQYTTKSPDNQSEKVCTTQV